MSYTTLKRLLLLFVGLMLVAALLFLLPSVRDRFAWRMEIARVYLRGVINPVGKMPTADPSRAPIETPVPSLTPTPTAPAPAPTDQPPTPTPIPSPTPTAIPQAVSLLPPAWEKQDINNCGPASLALYLRYYGWEGDQFTISDLIKPERTDRNVNVDELAYYVRNHAGWLNVEFRVAGDLDTLKKLIAAGIPVIVEESFYFDTPYWPNDDLWAAHYNLVTGYDDASQTVIAQDSFHGANQQIPYQTLLDYWRSFNYVYLLVYPPEKEATVKEILGANWEVDTNRALALERAQAETLTDPQNAFTWFNLGSNLVYFERYIEAADAFDKAREIGLPQRMLRYQFSPFFAYFHTGQIDDLLALTNYALRITNNAEEAFLWHGWALYRNGDSAGAIADFQKALVENPNYQDAQYALNFVQANP
jgi:tetratricopeptide (TPR) repeat protein